MVLLYITQKEVKSTMIKLYEAVTSKVIQVHVLEYYPPLCSSVSMSECLAPSERCYFPKQGHTVNVWFNHNCLYKRSPCTFPLCTLNLSLCLNYSGGRFFKEPTDKFTNRHRLKLVNDQKKQSHLFFGFGLKLDFGTKYLDKVAFICWDNEVLFCGQPVPLMRHNELTKLSDHYCVD